MGRRSAFALAILLLTLGAGNPPAAITGEVVETYCWAKMRIGGPQHAACGIQCAKRGIPVAIVDARSREVFVLLPGRDKMSVPQDLINAMGHKVTVRGEIVRRNGASFIAVQSWQRAR